MNEQSNETPGTQKVFTNQKPDNWSWNYLLTQILECNPNDQIPINFYIRDTATNEMSFYDFPNLDFVKARAFEELNELINKFEYGNDSKYDLPQKIAAFLKWKHYKPKS